MGIVTWVINWLLCQDDHVDTESLSHTRTSLYNCMAYLDHSLLGGHPTGQPLTAGPASFVLASTHPHLYKNQVDYT